MDESIGSQIMMLISLILIFSPCSVYAEALHAEESKAVVALQEQNGEAVHAGALLETGTEPKVFVDKLNGKVKLGPQSVGEFNAEGNFRLLRGSAFLDSDKERESTTAGAAIDYAGKILLSYDYHEKSTSVFVVQGEARLKNPFETDRTLIVDKNHGATMVVGEVYPTLIRKLDLASLGKWLEGYSWSEKDRKLFLHGFPARGEVQAEEKVNPAFDEVKLQDYFATIDTRNERPEYYDKKFADPDKVMAESKLKNKKGKELSPEEAALISLPSTKIDVDLGIAIDTLTTQERQAEILKRPREENAKRQIASVPAKKAGNSTVKATKSMSHEEEEIGLVLSRLKSLDKEGNNKPSKEREPASMPSSAVSDPVYDYSQNF